jgi:hypothetical protein
MRPRLEDGVSFSKAAASAAKATGVAFLGALAGTVAFMLSSLAESEAIRNSALVPLIYLVVVMAFGVALFYGLGGLAVAFLTLYEYLYTHWRKLSRFAAVPTLLVLFLPLLVIGLACFLFLGTAAVFAVGATVALWPITLIVILAAILCKK